jgi:hypothetical protein
VVTTLHRKKLIVLRNIARMRRVEETKQLSDCFVFLTGNFPLIGGHRTAVIQVCDVIEKIVMSFGVCEES